MPHGSRIEAALEDAVLAAEAAGCPPQLGLAIRNAVFPGGARVRPKLLLSVAAACGDDAPRLSSAAAAAIELLHCASLVHDDLPCFDNAHLRRGRPTVHVQFGEPVALLAGDGMIVMAFEALARAAPAAPARLGAVLGLITRAVGPPYGIVAGQAWESEPRVDVEAYHLSKTGALFMAATMTGAAAAGADPGPWRALGAELGAAYQVADDLMDALGQSEESGKTSGQDAALHRPNLVEELGVKGAVARLQAHVGAAIDAIPACEGAAALRELVRGQALRLAPKTLALTAA